MTATPTDSGDTVEILNGTTPVENGGNASWNVGDNTLTIKVKDRDDATSITIYTVTVHRNSDAKAITSFAIGDAVGTITEADHTVAVEVPSGTSVTALEPTIAVSTGASVSPASGAAADFTNPVTYTVTAEDGTTQEYVVTVTVGE